MNKKYKAIIQLTSADTQVHKSTIRQINNLLNSLTGTVQVRIICHGASSDFCKLKGNQYIDQIMELLAQEVEMVACLNMLEANQLKLHDLIPGITVIPSGIADLVVKQQEGWSYVKAGF